MMPVIVSRETIVTAILVYIMIGALIWMVLDGLGIIENTFVTKPNATRTAMVLATLMMIAAWPWFVRAFIRQRLLSKRARRASS